MLPTRSNVGQGNKRDPSVRKCLSTTRETLGADSLSRRLAQKRWYPHRRRHHLDLKPPSIQITPPPLSLSLFLSLGCFFFTFFLRCWVRYSSRHIHLRIGRSQRGAKETPTSRPTRKRKIFHLFFFGGIFLHFQIFQRPTCLNKPSMQKKSRIFHALDQDETVVDVCVCVCGFTGKTRG